MLNDKLIIKFLIVSSIILVSFQATNNTIVNKTIEDEILAELDSSFYGVSGKFYPKKNDSNILYNFFLDLEHGYFLTAGNKIHLFADKNRWAIIFEINGYHKIRYESQIRLIYVGNCIKYNKEKTPT